MPFSRLRVSLDSIEVTFFFVFCFVSPLDFPHFSHLGVEVTMLRAALLTAGQMASYDHSKYLLKKWGVLDEGVPLHIVYEPPSGQHLRPFHDVSPFSLSAEGAL